MEHFLLFRIVFWIALIVFILVSGLIFLLIERVGTKIRLLRTERAKYSELNDILPEQDGSLNQLTG